MVAGLQGAGRRVVRQRCDTGFELHPRGADPTVEPCFGEGAPTVGDGARIALVDTGPDRVAGEKVIEEEVGAAVAPVDAGMDALSEPGVGKPWPIRVQRTDLFAIDDVDGVGRDVVLHIGAAAEEVRLAVSPIHRGVHTLSEAGVHEVLATLTLAQSPRLTDLPGLLHNRVVRVPDL